MEPEIPPEKKGLLSDAAGTAAEAMEEQFPGFGPIRKFINRRVPPVKAGWYIFAGLLLVTGWYLHVGAKNDEVTEIAGERDKHFLALQPWQALAASIYPNAEADRRIGLLLMDVRRVTNQLARMEATLYQVMHNLDFEDGAVFANEFPLGYGLFGVTYETNVIPYSPSPQSFQYLPQSPLYLLQRDNPAIVVAWPTKESVAMDAQNIFIQIPLIWVGPNSISVSTFSLRRSLGVGVSVCFGQPGYSRKFRGVRFDTSDPCSVVVLNEKPEWAVVVRLVSIKKHGVVVLVGVKRMELPHVENTPPAETR